MGKVGRVLEGRVVPVEVLEPSVEVRVSVSHWKHREGSIAVLYRNMKWRKRVPRPKLHLKLRRSRAW